MPRAARIETRRLRDLKPHPCWALVIGGMSAASMAVLAADVNDRGMQRHIEVLPDNTIIDGMSLKDVATRHGLDSLAVLVRYDLADKTSDEIEYKMLADRANAKHLTRLGQARHIYRMCEHRTRTRMAAGGWEAAARAAARDDIARLLGITLRSVNAYMRAVIAPIAVQDACDRGEITLATVGRVAQLSMKHQREISRLLRADEAARRPGRAGTIVGRYVKIRPDRVSAATHFNRGVRAFGKHVPLMRSHLRGITPEHIAANETILRQTQALVDSLLTRADLN